MIVAANRLNAKIRDNNGLYRTLPGFFAPIAAPHHASSTILPIWALDSISACAAAASRNGKVL